MKRTAIQIIAHLILVIAGTTYIIVGCNNRELVTKVIRVPPCPEMECERIPCPGDDDDDDKRGDCFRCECVTEAGALKVEYRDKDGVRIELPADAGPFGTLCPQGWCPESNVCVPCGKGTRVHVTPADQVESPE